MSCPEPLEELAQWMRSGSLVLFVVGTITIVGSLVWWFVRREHNLLQQRSLGLAVCVGIAMELHLISTNWVIYNGRNTLPCDVHAWIAFWVVPLGAAPTAIRLMMFYNQHRYSQLVLSAKSKSSTLRVGNSMRFAERDFSRDLLAYIKMSLCFTGRKHKSLVYRTNRNEDKAEVLSVDDETTESGSTSTNKIVFFLGALRLSGTSSRFRVLSMAGFVLCGILLAVVQYFPRDESPYGGKGCFSCTLDSRDIIPIICTVVLVVSIGGVALYRIRGVPDPLKIKFELQVLTSMGIGVALAFVLQLLDVGKFGADFDWFFAASFLALSYHCMFTIYPILLTYGIDLDCCTKKTSHMDYVPTLEDVLEKPSARTMFAKYLATEFSMENLWFYEKVEEFTSTYDEMSNRAAMALADELMATFVADSSILQCNLSGPIRRTLESRFRKLPRNARPPRDLFDAAQHQIFELMRLDSLPRFLVSNFGKDLGIEPPREYKVTTAQDSFASDL